MSRPSTLSDLGVTRNESSLWQHVAAVPAEVRAAYVERTKDADGEVTTAGLLKHAGRLTAPRRDRPPIDHAAIAADARRRVRAVNAAVIALPAIRPEALVSALDAPERRNLLRALGQLPAWIEDVRKELAVHRIVQEE